MWLCDDCCCCWCWVENEAKPPGGDAAKPVEEAAGATAEELEAPGAAQGSSSTVSLPPHAEVEL